MVNKCGLFIIAVIIIYIQHAKMLCSTNRKILESGCQMSLPIIVQFPYLVRHNTSDWQKSVVTNPLLYAVAKHEIVYYR